MKTCYSRWFRTSLLTLLALLVSGCATQPAPERHTYLLRVPQGEASPVSPGRLSLAHVAVPGYLEAQEVMLMVSATEVRPARFHRWAEPPREGLTRYLSNRLANEPVATDYRVDVVVEELLGTESGNVRLRADYSLEDEAGGVVRGYFDRTVVQTSDGYPALVEAHAQLLEQLAEAIAETVPDRTP